MLNFSINKFKTTSGSTQWYWILHTETGHEYHFSTMYDSFVDCAEDLASDGLYWMEILDGAINTRFKG